MADEQYVPRPWLTRLLLCFRTYGSIPIQRRLLVRFLAASKQLCTRVAWRRRPCVLPTKNQTLKLASVAAVVCLGTAFASDALAASIDDAIERVGNYKSQHGSAPSLDFYFAEIEKEAFTNQQQAALYFELIKAQKPMVSLADIRAILTATRDAVHSFHVEYVCSSDPTGAVQVYAFSGNRVLISEGSGPDSSAVLAFDGQVLRQVNVQPDMTSARIERPQSLSELLRPYMPLNQAMMFNSALFGVESPASDLPEFISQLRYDVFENQEVVDGRNCVVVANYSFAFYLDIEQSFALRRLDVFDIELGASAEDGRQPMKGRRLTDQKIHSEFRDFGNGIWLPMKMKLVHYRGGKAPQEEVTTVLNMEVNPDLSEAIFRDIIPENASVSDGIRHLSYTYGDRATIGQFLSDQVSGKSRLSRVLIWVNVICVLALLLIFLIRRVAFAKTS